MLFWVLSIWKKIKAKWFEGKEYDVSFQLMNDTRKILDLINQLNI